MTVHFGATGKAQIDFEFYIYMLTDDGQICNFI